MAEMITIGGIQRRVELRLYDCQKILEEYNLYFSAQNLKIARKHADLLRLIDLASDKQEKLKLINEYTQKMQSDQALIRIPFMLIYDSIWRILASEERKNFRNKKKMIRAILMDEHEQLVYYVGSRILRMPGYKKKQ